MAFALQSALGITAQAVRVPALNYFIHQGKHPGEKIAGAYIAHQRIRIYRVQLVGAAIRLREACYAGSHPKNRSVDYCAENVEGRDGIFMVGYAKVEMCLLGSSYYTRMQMNTRRSSMKKRRCT